MPDGRRTEGDPAKSLLQCNQRYAFAPAQRQVPHARVLLAEGVG